MKQKNTDSDSDLELPPHFCMTRFGIGVLDEDYLSRRLDIFEAITLPSLAQQIDQRFYWCVFYDQGHPKSIVKRLNKLANNHPILRPIAMDPTAITHAQIGRIAWLDAELYRYIAKHNLVADIGDYIITSIIDDDDAWSVATIDLVHRALKQQIFEHPHYKIIQSEVYNHQMNSFNSHSAGALVSFPRGFNWHLEENIAQMDDFKCQSMSVFVLSRLSSGVTAHATVHHNWSQMAKSYNFRELYINPEDPHWLYVRHGEAVSSHKYKGGDWQQMNPDYLHRMFGVDLERVSAIRAYNRSQWKNDDIDLRHGLLPFYNQIKGQIHILAALNNRIQALESQIKTLSRSDQELKDHMKLILQQTKLRLKDEKISFRQAGCRVERKKIDISKNLLHYADKL